MLPSHIRYSLPLMYKSEDRREMKTIVKYTEAVFDF